MKPPDIKNVTDLDHLLFHELIVLSHEAMVLGLKLLEGHPVLVYEGSSMVIGNPILGLITDSSSVSIPINGDDSTTPAFTYS